MINKFALTVSISEIGDAAKALLFATGGTRIFAFSGGLGAGKTTLISALCRELGVKDAVSSPTFALINEYHFAADGKQGLIYHMDWYRLRDAEEAINAGVEDCLMRPDAWCFVEWPEQAMEILPSPHIFINLEYVSEQERFLVAEMR